MSRAALRLATERLILRRWDQADQAPFAALNADPRVGEWLAGPLPRELSDRLIERIEAHFETHGFGLWAVERCSDRRLIGMVGLQHVPFEAAFTPAVEIGWRLAFDCWGQGYAFEAARSALQHAVALAGLTEVVSFTARDNQRSQRVMQRLGFVYEPASDFAHPRLPAEHPLSLHHLYRWRAAENEAAC